MVDQPQGRTRYDDLVEKIDEMLADRVDEAIAPLLRQFEALERRVTELERTGQDGAVGMGDMLGGPSTGAGGRFGPDDVETTWPMPANQHSFADVELPGDADPDDPDSRDPA